MTDTPNSRRDLWRAVVDQALRDAVSREQSGRGIAARRQARTWLSRRSADLAEVCALAGLEPDVVLAKAAALIAEEDRRLEQGFGKGAKKPERQPRPLRRIELNGLNLTIREWAERTGISHQTINSRLNQGWDVERTLTQPISQGWAWRNKNKLILSGTKH